MKSKFLLPLVILPIILVVNTSFAQTLSVTYTISMPEPQNHYFYVTMKISPKPGPYTDFKIPAWAPGSYLIRDFAKYITYVSARDENSDSLSIIKTDKETWRVYHGKVKTIEFTYHVYAFKMSVRTSYLDDTEGYINGTSVFVYVPDLMQLPIDLNIQPPDSWKKITTGLPVDSNNPRLFHARDYDQLVDCPIEIGNQVIFDFQAAGIRHEVAMVGPGNYNIDKLKTYMARIAAACNDIFKDNENKKYVFIVHNLEVGDGGLEHSNSVSLSVNRWIYEPQSSYIGFLGLVAHEYLHQWIVKRLRPSTLVKYDYSKENYTDLLWVMEGFPSYYDNVLLCRLGYIHDNDYLNRLTGAINSVENMPGDRVQSVAGASFDAWIRQYQPDENFINSTVSYYTKGDVLGALLDLQVIEATHGKKSLDDVLRYLYEQYYKKNNTGITTETLEKAFQKFTGNDMTGFFDDYVLGTKPIDYKKFLSGARILAYDLNQDENVPFLGIGLQDQDGRSIVQTVYAGSAAEKAGISADDEIISVNGYRVNTSRFLNYMKFRQTGDTLNLIIARNNLIYHKTVELARDPRRHYSLYVMPAPTDEQKAVYNKWLFAK